MSCLPFFFSRTASRSGLLPDLTGMDENMRPEPGSDEDAISQIDRVIAGISDDEIEARLQWLLAAYRAGWQ